MLHAWKGEVFFGVDVHSTHLMSMKIKKEKIKNTLGATLTTKHEKLVTGEKNLFPLTTQHFWHQAL